MQLKTLLPSLLLLAEAAFAAPEDATPLGGYINASPLGVTKRNPFALMMQPHYMAMPLNDGASLAKRQNCPLGSNACYEGCCKTGTVCGIYGGEKGCCPVGKTCGGVSGCQDSSQVLCDGYCCPKGSTCAKDASGNDGCATEDDNSGNDDSNNGCDAGYSPCSIFQGCCPTGSECILPKNCNIPCTAEDPICGNGCCEKGTVCTKDFTCAPGDDNGDFTDLAPTTTATRTSRFISFTTTTEEAEVETTTTEEETSTTEEETSTTEESSTETTETSTSLDFFGNDATTTTTRSVARITITDSGNTAPTMAAMIGNGLGVAAGLLGALVL